NIGGIDLCFPIKLSRRGAVAGKYRRPCVIGAHRGGRHAGEGDAVVGPRRAPHLGRGESVGALIGADVNGRPRRTAHAVKVGRPRGGAAPRRNARIGAPAPVRQGIIAAAVRLIFGKARGALGIIDVGADREAPRIGHRYAVVAVMVVRADRAAGTGIGAFVHTVD